MTASARAEQFASASLDPLDESIDRARHALLALGKSDGHWCFELEADVHHSGRICAAAPLPRRAASTPCSRARSAVYLRRMQGDHGGWPLVSGRRLRHQRQRQGLFRAQDDRRQRRRASHGARARRYPARMAAPHAATCSRARCWRSMGQLPWRGVPVMPVEIMLLPQMVSVPSRQGILLGAHGSSSRCSC